MNTRVQILVLGALLAPSLSCSKGGDLIRDEGADAALPGRAQRDLADTAPADAAAPAVDAAAGGCAHPLPAGWPASFALYPYNPILRPTPSSSNQGADNVYAPEIHAHSGAKVMWYGAQGSDGHDRIYLAWSRDGMAWTKWPSDSAPAPVLDRGTSNHVNDPSVVRPAGTWRMYYTDAATAENDEIWLAESSKLTGFTKVQRVLEKGPPGAWDEEKVGRPSVLYEGGVYFMWYDGTSRGRRHVGLATSTDGIRFTRAPHNPVFRDAGAVDVKRVGGTLVMLREAADGTYFATSTDGICWIDRGRLFGLSGGGYDRYGQVTPFLEVDNGAGGGAVLGVWFGGASVATWNKNRIAAAFPKGTIPSGGGCTECVTPGLSCTSACQRGGLGSAGLCASPGSTLPGSCCGCQPSGCDACVAKGDCQAACVGSGLAGGWCAYPGSTMPGRCCACIE
ncbi:MAG: hypothetical protein U1A78_38775 [Polyangia bacterium]